MFRFGISSFTKIKARSFLANSGAQRGIVGGHAIPITEAPHAVALLDDQGKVYSSGSFIGDGWVISAGHSVHFKIPSSIRVGSCYAEEEGQVFQVKKVHIHPKYNKGKQFNCDVALIKLLEDVPISDQVKPIALPEPDEPPTIGKMHTVAGFGYTKTEKDKDLPKLHAVEVPVLSKDMLEKAYPGQITDSMMGAGFPGRDACPGDSGGPLSDGEKLVGIVSCGNEEGLPNCPGVYVRVSAVRDWIKEKTGI